MNSKCKAVFLKAKKKKIVSEHKRYYFLINNLSKKFSKDNGISKKWNYY